MTREEIRHILSDTASPEEVSRLHQIARSLTDEVFGRNVFVRALIEITNICRRNCLYCGIRHDSALADRYALTADEILSCCRMAFEAGFRTFVLQGGENPDYSSERIVAIVKAIKALFPEAAVTLSLGEWDDADLEDFREAGADRYLLRHETKNMAHYGRLHPPSMSLDNRLRCLFTLKRLGFQTGTGIMVGSPFQTVDHILEDIDFMLELKPEMIGIGPFIPAAGTPFSGFTAGSVELTLRLISVFRILFPTANIPATTALATLGGVDGRLAGIRAGANVVMPNVSPLSVRKAYRLYDNKECAGTEAIDGIDTLSCTLEAAGYRLSFSRGDAPINNQI